jgi:hypothetical protein
MLSSAHALNLRLEALSMAYTLWPAAFFFLCSLIRRTLLPSAFLSWCEHDAAAAALLDRPTSQVGGARVLLFDLGFCFAVVPSVAIFEDGVCVVVDSCENCTQATLNWRVNWSFGGGNHASLFKGSNFVSTQGK